MSLQPSSELLNDVLRIVARRYRLPAMAAFSDANAASAHIPGTSPTRQETSAETALAIAIEDARSAVARGATPDAALQRLFTQALARMINGAMRSETGDPAFQAMVLRHHVPQVREYASLSAHADQDRRLVHAQVNAIAHPAKQQRIPPGWQRETLAQLHTSASTASWSTLRDIAHRLLRMPQTSQEPPLEHGLSRLLDCPALDRLLRLEALASDGHGHQYQALWGRHGPRSGSPAAAAQGVSSRQRGAAVEALTAETLETLARRLNMVEGAGTPYRVVTSMRVPASIPASPEGAKSEWDVVLLRRADTAEPTPVWDICLLVEAKASVDAATSDLPRLLRGLRLLAHAEEDVMYPFETQQGTMRLRGASLRALASKEATLSKTVLYCCDAPAEETPRLLSAASRMQLLSAQASLEFAGMPAGERHANPHLLEPVWHQLLVAPRWSAVLHQYPMLHQVRELMVHTDDLLAAIKSAAGAGAVSD